MRRTKPEDPLFPILQRIASAEGQLSDLHEASSSLSHISGWDDSDPREFVGLAYALAEGDYINFTRPANTPYLVISVQGALVNVDYVVDSAGRGTHTELFSGDGALEDAIATGDDRVIWICPGHSETISTTHDLTNLADGQEITVVSAGINRPSFIVGAGLGAGTLIDHGTANSGGSDGSRLRFQGVSFSRPGAATAGPWFTGDGGWDIPDIDLIDVTFWGSSGNWTRIFDFTGATSADVGDILFERVVSEVNIGALVRVDSQMDSIGKFVVSNCDFASLDYIQERDASTDVDVGREGTIITNNLFRIITAYAWSRTYDTGPGDHWPFVFDGNVILDYTGNAPCLQIGTSGTTSPADVTISGNVIFCSNDHADTRAVKVMGGAGTAQNIAICGNALQGPGGVAAHIAVEFDIANTGCHVCGGFRDWNTDIGGSDIPDVDIPGDICVAGDQGIAGYLHVGSCTPPTDTTAGDLTTTRLVVDSYMSIGQALDTDIGLALTRTWANESASHTGQGVAITAIATGTGATRDIIGITGIALSALSSKPTDVLGLDFQVGLGGAAGATNLIGTRSALVALNASSGSVDDAIGYELASSWIGSAAVTLDQFTGYHCPDLSDRATGAASNVFGFRVDALDADATPNLYPFWYGDVGSGLWYLDDTGNMFLDTSNYIQFRDSGLRILSSADGQLDIDADTQVEITAPTIDLTGAVTVSSTLDVEGNINAAGEIILDRANVISVISKSRQAAGDQFLDIDFDGLQAAEDARIRIFRSSAPAGADDRFTIYVPNTATIALEMYANSQRLALPGTGSGAGVLIGGDAQLFRGAADRLDLASGDAFVILGGAGDFAGPTNGMLWYNTTSNKFRGYENGAWADVIGGGGANHDILDGSVHQDSVADAVTRGSIIYGNATPKWDELVIGGAGAALTSDGTDASWVAATRTIILTAGGGYPTTTSGCSTPTRVEAGTNDVDYWVLDFDTDADEYAFWGPFVMPDNWDGGATITAVFYWTALGGAAAQTVTWSIQMASRDEGDPIDDAWGAAVTVADTWTVDGDVHKTSATGNITPDTAGARAGGDLMFVRVMRDVSEDDLAVDARLIAVKLEYVTNVYSD